MSRRHLYALPLLGLLAACGDDGLSERPIYRAPGDEADDPGINPWWDASERAVSTFSVDVDTASYARVRRALRDGRRPNPTEVRPEEIINYLDFADPGPPRGHPHP